MTKDREEQFVYNSSAASNDPLGFMDMNEEGSAPLSLQDGNITITWSGSGLFSVSL